MTKHIGLFLAGAVALTVASSANAQEVQSVSKSYSWSSGSVQNNSGFDKMVARHVVYAPRNAAGLRLHFEKSRLGANAVVRILTSYDHQIIILDDKKIATFKFSTPYLNGSSAIIELWLRSGSASAGVSLRGIEAILPASRPMKESICGTTDDRVASEIPPIARMMGTLSDPGGCTGTLISENCMVSAGHCAGVLNIAQFNVPTSNDDGRINHPKAEDQYALEKLYDSQDQGEGEDWSVYRLKPNPLTGKTAGSVQGAFTIRTGPTRPGDRIRISGYGVDTGNSNASQQTNTATVKAIDGSAIKHEVDTEPGNSGSTIINEETKEIVGIHTHGGCSSGGNRGTLIVAHERFKRAIAACLADERTERFETGRNR